VRQLGLSSALSQLFKDGKVFVVEDMKADGKTKEIAKRMKTFGLNKAVLVSGSGDEMFSRAARNLQGVRYYSVDGLNVYDLLRYGSLIFSKDSLAAISRRCGVGGDL
jgi:large subunit ribosomal protein L4